MMIDTDIFIDFLRKNPEAEKFFYALDLDTAVFSAVTEAELISGKECDSPLVRERILHLLSSLTKIHVDNKIAQTAGDYCRRYGIALQDALIAATAFHSNEKLATRNARDFSKIKEIKAEAPY
jgi:predicted nucleic acid-binding protein